MAQVLGNQRHIIVPGLGPVVAQAGDYTFNILTGEVLSISGLDSVDGAAFCGALAA